MPWFQSHQIISPRALTSAVLSMSVELELGIADQSFELGRILQDSNRDRCTLESLVPLDSPAIPLVRVRSEDLEPFEAAVRDHQSVTRFERLTDGTGQALYELRWATEEDPFFDAIIENDGHILEASGRDRAWHFVLLFQDRDQVSAFNARVTAADIDFDVISVGTPSAPRTTAWDRLTPAQRDALGRAVEAGYYDIPRRISTTDLAAEFGISDQAMIERLRRAVSTLASTASRNGPQQN